MKLQSLNMAGIGMVHWTGKVRMHYAGQGVLPRILIGCRTGGCKQVTLTQSHCHRATMRENDRIGEFYDAHSYPNSPDGMGNVLEESRVNIQLFRH